MNHEEAVFAYLKIFFETHEFDALSDLFGNPFSFEGPFLKTDSAEEYIAAMKSAPPTGCSYRLLHMFGRGEAVNVLYEFTKPGIRTKMSQLFEFKDGKISRILLIFDRSVFD